MTPHQHLMENMRNFAMRMGRSMNDVMRAHGASLAQMKLLTFIQRGKSVRSTDISDAFGFAPRTVTEAIDALERDGLILRTPDPTDRRAKRIALTREGKAVLIKVEPAGFAFTEKLFAVLTAAEEQELLRLLQKLNGRLQELRPENMPDREDNLLKEEIDQR